jgi:hypothetical protein
MAHLTESPDTNPTPPGRPVKRRRRRWRRRLLTGLILIVVLLGAAAFIVTRPAFMHTVCEQGLREIAHADVSMSEARIEDGRIVMTNLLIRADDVPGSAGEIIFAPRVTIEPALDDLLKLRFTPRIIEIDKPVIRASQSSVDGSLSLASILRQGGAGDQALPTVVLRDATIEYGEHDEEGTFSRLNYLTVSGSLRRDTTAPDRFAVALDKITPFDADKPAGRIEGWISPQSGSGELRMPAFALEVWSDVAVPERVRRWWSSASVKGQLNEAVLSFTPDRVDAAFELRGVDLEFDLPLPESVENRKLRLTDVNGSLRFDQEGIELEQLIGRVEDLTCTVNGEYRGYDDAGPFTFTMRVDPFDATKAKEESRRFLPADIVAELDEFRVERGRAAGTVTISRAPDAERVRLNGRFDLTGFAGVSEYFSYPVVDASGRVEFSDERVDISISGVGPESTSTKIGIDVTLVPRSPKPDVFVNVQAENVMDDQYLREALWDDSRQVLTDLLDEPSYERLIRAGLLMPPAAQEAIEAALRDARLQRAALLPGTLPQTREQIELIDERIAEYESKLGPEPFELGVLADVSATVERTPGTDMRYLHEVEISFDAGAFLYRHFPYPIRVTEGSIVVTDELATIDLPELIGPDDTPIGRIEAEIILEEDGQDVYLPDINIFVDRMALDPYLMHAIPSLGSEAASIDEPPSAGGRVLSAFNLDGSLVGKARIYADEGGRTRYAVRGEVIDATAAPGDGSYPLTGLTASYDITDEAVSIERLVARHGDTVIEAGGTIPLLREATEPRPTELHLRFEALDLTEPFLALAEPLTESAFLEGADPEAFWAKLEALEPAGIVDADLRINATPDGQTDQSLRLNARDLALTVDGVRIQLEGQASNIEIAEGGVFLTETECRLIDGPRTVAIATLNGYWPEQNAASATRPGELLVSLRDLRPESDAVRSIVGLFADDDIVEMLDAVDPAGLVEGEAELRENAAGELDLALRLRPHRLDVNWAGERLEFSRMEGLVRYADGTLRLDDVHGRMQDGTCSVDGVVQFGAAGSDGEPDEIERVDLDVTADFAGLSSRVRAVLPAVLTEWMDSISFEADDRLSLSDGRIHYRRGAAADGRRITVQGRIDFAGARASLGMPIVDAVGHATIDFARRPNLPVAELNVDGRIDHMRIRGLRVSDVLLRIANGDEPGEYVIPQLEAACHGGKLAASARLLARDSLFYQCQLSAVGMELAPLLADLRSYQRERLGPAAVPSTDDSATVDTPNEDRTKVQLFAGLSGFSGDPDALRGSVNVRIEGGEVVSLPVLTALIQLSNFVPIENETYDMASIGFQLAGRKAEFREIEVYGDSVWIRGDGVVSLDDLGIDIRFTTGSWLEGMTFVSDLFYKLRDEIVTMQAGGTLYDPSFQPVALSGTRSTIGTILGFDEPPRPPQRRPRDNDL